MHLLTSFVFIALAVVVGTPAFAAEGAASNGMTALAAAIAISVAAVGGAMAQGRAVAAALDGLARNPEAKVTGPMIIGLALIESLVIYAFVVALQLAGKA